MTIQESLTTVLTKKYADFSGRARRSEYWWFALAYFVLNSVLRVLNDVPLVPLLGALVGLALLVPSLAVGARRLHDTGRSGWWQLLWFAIIIGWIPLIIWLAADGKPEANEHGANPKAQPAPYGA